MRHFLIVLAIALVSSHTLVHGRESVAEFATHSEGQLVRMLEKFKDILRNGNSSLDIPILDPLVQEHLDIALNKNSLISVQGSLDDLRADGLSNYRVDRGDFAIIGLKVNVALTWEELEAKSKYNLNGKIGSEVPLYGNGDVRIVANGLKVMVDMKLSVKNKKLTVSSLQLHVRLAKLNLDITGLYNDEEVSKVMSQIVSNILPVLIDDYQTKISEIASPILAEKMNDILNQFTLKDLLDMISG